MLYWIWLFVCTLSATYFAYQDNRKKGSFNSWSAMVAAVSIILGLWVSIFIILSPLFHYLMDVLPQKEDAINPITAMVMTVFVAAVYVLGIFKAADIMAKVKNKSPRTANNGC